MTIKEFQAWLDGYSAAIQGPPNAQQWELIKSKIAKIHSSDTKPDLTDYFPQKTKTTYPKPNWRYVDEFTYVEPVEPNSVY